MNNHSTLSLIREAQELLERIPPCGVGRDGASMEVIKKYERQGSVLFDDAVYHEAQKAWLLLEQAAKLEEAKP